MPAVLKIRVTDVEGRGTPLSSLLLYLLIGLVAGGLAVGALLLKRNHDPEPQSGEPRPVSNPGDDSTGNLDKNQLERVCEKYPISNRERAVIRFLCEGKSSREIAELLFISFHTAKNHIRNIYRKLKVKNRVSLINMLRQNGKQD